MLKSLEKAGGMKYALREIVSSMGGVYMIHGASIAFNNVYLILRFRILKIDHRHKGANADLERVASDIGEQALHLEAEEKEYDPFLMVQILR